MRDSPDTLKIGKSSNGTFRCKSSVKRESASTTKRRKPAEEVLVLNYFAGDDSSSSSDGDDDKLSDQYMVAVEEAREKLARISKTYEVRRREITPSLNFYETFVVEIITITH